MKKREMIHLYHYVKSILTKDAMFPSKFIYMMSKNKKRMESELINIQNAQPKPSPELEKRRVAILTEHLIKDEDGKIIWENEQEQIPKYDDVTAVKGKLEELEKEFKTEIEQYQKEVDEFNEYLDTDIDFEFSTTHFDNFPKEMSMEMMEKLEVFVSNY